MATIIPGTVIHTEAGELSRIKPQISPEVALYDADIYPLTHLTRSIQKKVIYGHTIQWQDDEYVPKWDTVDGAIGGTSGDVTLTVDNTYYKAYDLLALPTLGENVRVESVDSTGKILTVKRGVGSSISAIGDGIPIFKLAESFPEGSGAATPIYTQMIPRTTHTHITKKSIEETNTMSQVEKWTGDDLARHRMKKLKLWKIDAESVSLFSKKSRDTSGTTPVSTTDGILNIPNLNLKNMVGSPPAAMNEAALRVIMKTAFRFSSKRKLLCLAGATFVERIDSWGADKMRLRPAEETYGVTINRFLTAFGELNIINHYQLEGSVYGGYAILIDLSYCWYCPLGNRDIHLEPNIGLKTDDKTFDQWLAEYAFRFEMGKAHTLMYNIS